jgi:hypothetical protein
MSDNHHDLGHGEATNGADNGTDEHLYGGLEGGNSENAASDGLQQQDHDHDKPAEETYEGKIFIGGISWQTTEDGLRYYFEKFGELADVALMKDKQTGTPRGFGFVTFKSASGECPPCCRVASRGGLDQAVSPLCSLGASSGSRTL